jgi:hypothetical protein
MVKPVVQVIRFDNSNIVNSCNPECTYQCGSDNPGCQGVCVGEACPSED